LPDGSRKPASIPYGCWVGSWENSTPLLFSSSYVFLDVVRREEEPARGALGDERVDRRARLVVEDGRPRHGEQRELDVLARQAHREPAEVAHLGHRDVVAQLESERLGVEGERLVLVVDPHVHVRQLLQHVDLRVVGVERSR
jgi:hypothetical protein